MTEADRRLIRFLRTHPVCRFYEKEKWTNVCLSLLCPTSGTTSIVVFGILIEHRTYRILSSFSIYGCEMSVTFAQRGRPPPNPAQIQKVINDIYCSHQFISALNIKRFERCIDARREQSSHTDHPGISEQRKTSGMHSVSFFINNNIDSICHCWNDSFLIADTNKYCIATWYTLLPSLTPTKTSKPYFRSVISHPLLETSD